MFSCVHSFYLGDILLLQEGLDDSRVAEDDQKSSTNTGRQTCSASVRRRSLTALAHPFPSPKSSSSLSSRTAPAVACNAHYLRYQCPAGAACHALLRQVTAPVHYHSRVFLQFPNGLIRAVFTQSDDIIPALQHQPAVIQTRKQLKQTTFNIRRNRTLSDANKDIVGILGTHHCQHRRIRSDLHPQ